MLPGIGGVELLKRMKASEEFQEIPVIMAIARAAQEMAEKKIEFSEQARGELAVLEQAVLDIVNRTVSAYRSFDLENAVKIEPQEQVVDALVREVKSRHVRRLRDGLCTASTDDLYSPELPPKSPDFGGFPLV